MQVIRSERPGESVARVTMVWATAVGSALILVAAVLAGLLFGTGFLTAVVPSGRASAGQLVVGAAAWAFALIAPTAFGLLGVVRVGGVVARVRQRRRRVTPGLRAAAAIGDDHTILTRVRLPDGSRMIPELIIGPFGAAILEELPPAKAVVSRGPRTWEVRLADDRVHMIDHPLERASRDADRIRTWLGEADADHVVKTYAAVVGTDPTVTRTPTCAYIRPDQVGPWLASLPPQRSLDAERRERIIRLIREAL